DRMRCALLDAHYFRAEILVRQRDGLFRGAGDSSIKQAGLFLRCLLARFDEGRQFSLERRTDFLELRAITLHPARDRVEPPVYHCPNLLSDLANTFFQNVGLCVSCLPGLSSEICQALVYAGLDFLSLGEIRFQT